MAKKKQTELVYHEVTVPGLGRVQVPTHLTAEEVLAEITGTDAEATPKKKTAKKR